MKLLACAATLALLTACGGSNTDMTPVGPSPQVPTRAPTSTPTPTTPTGGAPSLAQLNGDLTDLQNDYARISNFSLTTPANIPTGGTSRFDGGAAVLATRGGTEYSLIGDSRVNVNFATERMAGRASNFRGFNSDGDTFNVGGEITYSGGEIGVSGVPQAFDLNYNGTLNAGGDIMGLRGTATGLFSGNRTSGGIRTRALQGISGTNGSITTQSGGTANMTATVNGAPATADFVFFGQN